MRLKINVLEDIDGVLQAVTREMTEEEYAAHLEMIKSAEEGEE